MFCKRYSVLPQPVKENPANLGKAPPPQAIPGRPLALPNGVWPRQTPTCRAQSLIWPTAKKKCAAVVVNTRSAVLPRSGKMENGKWGKMGIRWGKMGISPILGRRFTGPSGCRRPGLSLTPAPWSANRPAFLSLHFGFCVNPFAELLKIGRVAGRDKHLVQGACVDDNHSEHGRPVRAHHRNHYSPAQVTCPNPEETFRGKVEAGDLSHAGDDVVQGLLESLGKAHLSELDLSHLSPGSQRYLT